MPSTGLLLAAASALLLVLLALALRLRGPGGPRDLTGPPKRRRIGWADARRLGALLAAGDRAAALRRLRELGYPEADSAKLLALAERLEAPPEPGPPGPAPRD